MTVVSGGLSVRQEPTGPLSALSMGVASGVERDSPELIRTALSPARIQDFHDDRRILVVDDVPETAQRVAGLLESLYGAVEYETDPTLVADRVRKASAEGAPYDALVLDLYMPKQHGLELLRALGEFAPAVVLHTGSMMAPAVSDLTIQMNSYVSGGGEALFAEYKGRQDLRGLPTVAVQVHHKLHSLAILVDKLDATMLLREHATDSTADFLHTFQPRLHEVHVTEQTAHVVAEEVRNFASAMQEILSGLLADDKFRSSLFWSQNGERIMQAVAGMGEITCSSLLGESAASTGSRLHDVVNAVAQLRAPDLNSYTGGGASGRTLSLLRQWSDVSCGVRRALSERYAAFDAYHRGELHLGDFVVECFPDAQISIDEEDDEASRALLQPILRDPDHLVRNFILSAVSVHGKRVEGRADLANTIWAELSPESAIYRDHVPEADVRRCGAINCGDHWTLRFNDTSGRSLDQDYGALMPAAVALERAGLAVVSTAEYAELSTLLIYVKTGERQGDYVEQLQAIVDGEVKQPDGSWIFTFSRERGEKFPVQEGLGSAADIITIGDRPEEMNRSSKPMLYRHQSFRFWGDSGKYSHYESAILINELIARLHARRGELRQSEERLTSREDPAKEIYDDGVRVTGGPDGEVFLDISSSDAPSHWAYQTLRELGIPAEKIVAGASF
ncbi:hypothetical protein MRY87_03590 [bacterium]|nr:hypothetical protein [bacterium]